MRPPMSAAAMRAASQLTLLREDGGCFPFADSTVALEFAGALLSSPVPGLCSCLVLD